MLSKNKGYIIRTTKEEKDKVNLFIKELQELNEKGLVKMLEKGNRKDLIEVNDVDVIRGFFCAVGYYVFSEG